MPKTPGYRETPFLAGDTWQDCVTKMWLRICQLEDELEAIQNNPAVKDAYEKYLLVKKLAENDNGS